MNSEWISVKEAMPKIATSVLCVVKNHVGKIVVVLSREQTTHDGIIEWIATFVFRPPKELGDDLYPVVKNECVTHWMPLPELPK